MHENRETSVAPEEVTGRSGKAEGRTPGMHATEGSDSGVVAVNQPNKSGQPRAEVWEGRPGIKGPPRWIFPALLRYYASSETREASPRSRTTLSLAFAGPDDKRRKPASNGPDLD
jgi:hypothetical protein